MQAHTRVHTAVIHSRVTSSGGQRRCPGPSPRCSPTVPCPPDISTPLSLAESPSQLAWGPKLHPHAPLYARANWKANLNRAKFVPIGTRHTKITHMHTHTYTHTHSTEQHNTHIYRQTYTHTHAHTHTHTHTHSTAQHNTHIQTDVHIHTQTKTTIPRNSLCLSH